MNAHQSTRVPAQATRRTIVTITGLILAVAASSTIQGDTILALSKATYDINYIDIGGEKFDDRSATPFPIGVLALGNFVRGDGTGQADLVLNATRSVASVDGSAMIAAGFFQGEDSFMNAGAQTTFQVRVKAKAGARKDITSVPVIIKATGSVSCSPLSELNNAGAEAAVTAGSFFTDVATCGTLGHSPSFSDNTRSLFSVGIPVDVFKNAFAV